MEKNSRHGSRWHLCTSCGGLKLICQPSLPDQIFHRAEFCTISLQWKCKVRMQCLASLIHVNSVLGFPYTCYLYSWVSIYVALLPLSFWKHLSSWVQVQPLSSAHTVIGMQSIPSTAHRHYRNTNKLIAYTNALVQLLWADLQGATDLPSEI